MSERCVSPRWRDTAERYGYHLVITPYLHFPFRSRTWQSERENDNRRRRKKEGEKKREEEFDGDEERKEKKTKRKVNQRNGSVGRKPEERDKN